MVRERVKQLSEPLWRPVVRHIDTRFNRLLARLDDLDSRLERFERSSGAPPWPGRDAAEGVGPADAAWLSTLHQRLDALSDDVWHSKAVNLGDRLLVGARHLGLVFLVQADDRLIGPRFVIDGEYEPETTEFMRRTVGETSVCIDVGANFGYYTCLLARLAWRGRTYAFEADPQVHALLRENVFINWCERLVEPIIRAVADQEESFRSFGELGDRATPASSAPRRRSSNILPSHRPRNSGLRAPRSTPSPLTGRLERLDLVKIDVEGAESLVVRGMGELVRHHRPTIVMEWSPWQSERAGFALDDLIGQLAALDLTPHVLGADGSPRAISYEALAALDYQNIVLRPAA